MAVADDGATEPSSLHPQHVLQAACAEHRARSQEVSRNRREASTSRETSALRRAMRGVSGAVRRAPGTVEELERLVHNEAAFARDSVADLDTKVQDARRQVSLHERMTSVMAKEITYLVSQNLRGTGGL